jgi:hypothetical protein
LAIVAQTELQLFLIKTVGVIPGGAQRREGDPDFAVLQVSREVWFPFPARCAGRRERQRG